MFRPPIAVAIWIMLAAVWSTVAEAQFQTGASSFGSGFGGFGGGFGSGFGSTSSMGGFGSSGFGNAGFGASRFGSSGMGGFGGGFGGSGFGTSGFGNAGFGGTRFGSGMGSAGFGGGSVFGNQGMGMGGYGGGSQNFVGRDAADMQATFTQMGRAGTQFFNQMNRNMSRRERSRDTPQPVEKTPSPVRVELRVAFAATQPAPSAVESTIRSRLGRILPQHNIAQPVVTMQGDTAVLSGVAASESERLVLERLIALEPGVRQVRNEMTIAAPMDASSAQVQN